MVTITFRREDLIRPEDSDEMTVRIECAPDCDWLYSEHYGYRNPSPHFHVVAKGRAPDTSERIACVEVSVGDLKFPT